MIRVLSVLLLLVLAAPRALAEEERAAPPTGPVSVDDVVRIALRNNYGYLRSEARVDAASGGKMEAWSTILPNVSATADWGYVDSHADQDVSFITVSQNDTTLILNSDSQNQGPGVSVRVSESIGISSFLGVKSASRNLEAAEWGSEAAAQETAFQARQMYYLVVRAQDVLRVQEEDLRLANDELRRTRSMYELGSVAKVDVLKAEVRVADAEVVLIQARNRAETERFALAKLLGFGPLTPLDLEGNLEQPLVADIDSAQAVEDALNRPDVRSARASYESAAAGAASAGWSRFPELFASFNWNTGKTDVEGARDDLFFDNNGNPIVSRGIPFDSQSRSDAWSVSAGLTLNLDVFLNSGAAKRAGGFAREAEYALEDQRLLAVQELATSVLTYRAAIAALAAAQRGVTAAEEDYRLSQERYAQGLGTILDLLTAQVALTRARNQFVDSQAALRIAEAGVQRARGAPLPS